MKYIFSNVLFYFRVLLFFNVAIILITYRIDDFLQDYKDFTIIICLLLPIVFIFGIMIHDVYTISKKTLTIKKDLIILSDKIIMYIGVGFLHLVLYVLNFNKYDTVIIANYIIILLLGIAFYVRFDIYTNWSYIKSKRCLLKKTKYISLIFIILFQLILVNQKSLVHYLDVITKDIQKYIKKGKGRSYLKVDYKRQILY